MTALAERSKHSPCLLILGFVAERMQSLVKGHSHSTSVRHPFILYMTFHLTASKRSKQKLRAVSWGSVL